jgi:hypothetical protein
MYVFNTKIIKFSYSVLVDTNFLSHTVQRKLPLLETLMDTFYGECGFVLVVLEEEGGFGGVLRSYVETPRLHSSQTFHEHAC